MRVHPLADPALTFAQLVCRLSPLTRRRRPAAFRYWTWRKFAGL